MSIIPFDYDEKQIIIDVDKMEEEGRQICFNNDFMKTLMMTVENPYCKKLLSEYCQTGLDTKTVCMYLKLYSSIDQRYNRELSPYQKICIVSNLIKNKQTRRLIAQKTQEFLN